MEKNNKKVWKVIGWTAAVVVTAVVIQWARFYNQISKLGANSAVVFPRNYFPFNGSYSKDASGNVVKA